MFVRLMTLPSSSSWYAEVAVPSVGPSYLGRLCVWYVLEFLLYIWVWSLASLVFLDGVLQIKDDVLVHGVGEEHDQRLRAVLERFQEAGLTLRREKCHLGKSEVR